MRKPLKQQFRTPVALVLAVALSGCLSGKITKSRRDFYAGDYAAAAQRLAEIKDKAGKNQILALLEYGMAQHEAGNYSESTAALLEADKIIRKEDVVHVGEETGSMVSNEMITTYRPESFETVLVHTYLAMNFMLSDDWSAARVEAKRTLEVLDSLNPELQGQSFARYVCGLAYEMMNDRSDAYIEYSKVIENAPGFLPLYYDLYRLAAYGGRPEARKWAGEIRKHGGDVSGRPEPPNLIVFVGAGRSPIKHEINIVVPPHANRFVVPEYVSSNSAAHHAVVRIGSEYSATSYVLTDLNPLAKLTLKKRIAKEIAKEVARVATKEVIVKQIEDQNPWLGLIARIFFFATEAADTRSWESLPRYLGVAVDTLPPGTYKVSVDFYAENGAPVGMVSEGDIEIGEGRRTVLSVRSIR